MGKIRPKGGGDPIYRGATDGTEPAASKKGGGATGGDGRGVHRDVAVDRARSTAANAQGAPGRARQIDKGGAEKAKGSALLIRGMTAGLTERLERERAKRGLRSRNDAILEILDEGAMK